MSGDTVLFQPGGYDRHQGPLVSPRARLLRLTMLFWNDFFARNNARAAMVLNAVVTLLAMAYVVLRGQVTLFAVAETEQCAFVLQTLGVALAVLAAIALWHGAARIAPLLAEDASQGALLLYFTRPVQRQHYLLARCTAASLGTALILAVPMVLLLLVLLSQTGLQPGGCPWQGWLGILWWLSLLVAALVTAVVMAAGVTFTALAAGLWPRSPSAAPMAVGGGVLGSVALSWVLQAAWGRDSVARAFDLHHALQAPWTLLTWLLEPQAPPQPLLHDACGGLLIWLALAAAAWWWLERFMANPPLGKGRAG